MYMWLMLEALHSTCWSPRPRQQRPESDPLAENYSTRALQLLSIDTAKIAEFAGRSWMQPQRSYVWRPENEDEKDEQLLIWLVRQVRPGVLLANLGRIDMFSFVFMTGLIGQWFCSTRMHWFKEWIDKNQSQLMSNQLYQLAKKLKSISPNFGRRMPTFCRGWWPQNRFFWQKLVLTQNSEAPIQKYSYWWKEGKYHDIR